MSQNSLVIPTTGTLSGLSLVEGVNSALDSLNTLNSGGSTPSTTEADMWWMDTTNGLLKQRDPSNSTWLIQGVRGIQNGGGLRHSGQSAMITSNVTLTSANIGQMIFLNPTAPITVTLPTAASCAPFVGFILVNLSTQLITIAAASGSGNSLDQEPQLGAGDQLWVVGDGNAGWHFLFRSQVAALWANGNGFVRADNGFIYQWGAIAVGSQANATFTFPDTFPSACYAAFATPIDGGLTANYRGSIGGAPTASAAVVVNSGPQTLTYYVWAVGR